MSLSSQLVSGDGGPIVVLQESVFEKWNAGQGIPMIAGGTEFTDYDSICEAEEVSVLQRYDRDLLVLSDSSWSARFLTYESDVWILQFFGTDRSDIELIENFKSGEPTDSFNFNLKETEIRLMVGADSKELGLYDSVQKTLKSGTYRIDAWINQEALALRFFNS